MISGLAPSGGSVVAGWTDLGERPVISGLGPARAPGLPEAIIFFSGNGMLLRKLDPKDNRAEVGAEATEGV